MTPTLIDHEGIPRVVQRVTVAGPAGCGTTLCVSLFDGRTVWLTTSEPLAQVRQALEQRASHVYEVCEASVIRDYFPKLAALTAGA